MTDSPYNEEWFDSLEQYNPFIETAFYAVIAHLEKPQSFLDLGCGTGHLLRVAKNIGVQSVVGVEISNEPARKLPASSGYFVCHDLADRLDLDFRFDIVWCTEVAEHIPENSADVLCDNIVSHTGRFLVFTAAHPDQGGRFHLNEQPQEYWRNKLIVRGLNYLPDETERLRETWRFTTGPCSWLPANLQVFARAG